MQIKNSNDHYGMIAMILHWAMAILLIALLILGLRMTGLPISLEKLKFYGWHKEYGILALILFIIRIIWRFMDITPSLSLPLMEIIAARAVHWAFYGFMFTIPMTGWLITSAAGVPVSFFGLYVLPNLIRPNNDIMILFQEIHKWLGYGLITTIILHAFAAFKHHFINKDTILRRMLP
jgi:cytochrome b561